MKALKIGLLAYLVFHLYTSLTINFSGYTQFDNEEYAHRLNPFGKFVAQNIDASAHQPNFIKDIIHFQSTFTGTNRGYSFFSPNVSRFNMKLLFIVDGEEMHVPLNTQESVLKFETASYFFESNFRHKKVRTDILKSFSKWYFASNPDIEKIDVYLDMYQFDNLTKVRTTGYKVKHQKLLGFTISKKELKQNQS